MVNMQRPHKLFGIFLILWLLTSLAAILGMYNLWWTREHRLYDDRSVYEQRMEVFKRAGISPELLKDIEVIDRNWPRYIRYGTVGDHNQLSYVKYLLLPRIPSGNDNLMITEKAGRLYTNVNFKGNGEKSDYPPKIRSFLISLLLLLGAAILIKSFNFFQKLSLPEVFAVVLLLLTIITVISKALYRDATFGFWLVSGLGICGWVLYVLKTFGNKRDLKFGKLFDDCNFFSLDIVKSRYIFILLFFIIGLTFLWSILMSVVVVPDDWDAWAIWGAKAKVLALGHGHINDVTLFDHADYPLLWPSLWAFTGWCAGGWEEHWSRAWGPIFMLLCAWETGIVIHRLSLSVAAGLLGAAFFVSIPMVPLISSWSYAEAPLWLMMTCSFGYLLSWQKERQWQQLVVSGLFAAAAAYTKNEGLFYASLGLIWILSCRPKNLFSACALYITPLLLLYAPWFIWTRTVLHIESHALVGLNLDHRTMIYALNRLMPLVESIAKMWADVRQWNIVLWGLLLSTIYLCFVKGNDGRSQLLIPVLMLFSSFIIVAFHPSDLHWLVAASWNRITIQTLPLFLVAIIPSLYIRADSRELTHEN